MENESTELAVLREESLKNKDEIAELKAKNDNLIKEKSDVDKANGDLTKLNSSLFLRVSGESTPDKPEEEHIEDPVEFYEKHKERYEKPKGKKD